MRRLLQALSALISILLITSMPAIGANSSTVVSFGTEAQVAALGAAAPQYPKVFVENYSATGAGLNLTLTSPCPSAAPPKVQIAVTGFSAGCYVQSSVPLNYGLTGPTPVQIGGDLGGTAASPTVVGVSHLGTNALASVPPGAGLLPVGNGGANQTVLKLSQYTQPVTETTALNLDSLAAAAGVPWTCDAPYTITATTTYNAQVFTAPGCVPTHTTHPVTYSKGFVTPDLLPVFPATDTGRVVTNTGRVSVITYGAKQDTPLSVAQARGAVTTDNDTAISSAVATVLASFGPGGGTPELVFPNSRGDSYQYGTTGTYTLTSPINITMKSPVYATGANHLFTWQPGSGAAHVLLDLDVYCGPNSLGPITFNGTDGPIVVRMQSWLCTSSAATSSALAYFTGTNVGIKFVDSNVREFFRLIDERDSNSSDVVSDIDIAGGAFRSSVTQDTGGWIKLPRLLNFSVSGINYWSNTNAAAARLFDIGDGASYVSEIPVDGFTVSPTQYFEGPFTSDFYIGYGTYGSGGVHPKGINIALGAGSDNHTTLSGYYVDLKAVTGYKLEFVNIPSPFSGGGKWAKLDGTSSGTLIGASYPGSCAPFDLAGSNTNVLMTIAGCGTSTDLGTTWVTSASAPTSGASTLTDVSGASPALNFTGLVDSFTWAQTGKTVCAFLRFTFPSTSDTNPVLLSGFGPVGSTANGYALLSVSTSVAGAWQLRVNNSANTAYMFGAGGTPATNVTFSGASVLANGCYQIN